MNSEVRYDFENLYNAILPNALKRNENLPSLCIDECLNRTEIRQLSKLSLREALISESQPVWYQTRELDSGEKIKFVGNAPKDIDLPVEIGKPAKGAEAVWDDQQVAYILFAQLYKGPVIFLSENLRKDRLGIRNILHAHIGPMITKEISFRVIYKKGKTDISEYCENVIEILRSRETPGGYTVDFI